MSSSSKKIIFWGTPEFALPSLQALLKLDLVKAVVTQPDRPAGRGQKIVISAVKQLAQDNNLPVLQFAKLDDDFITALEKYLPGTFVIVAYGKIIPQIVLDLSELKALNIHPSKLPELRGPSPIQTAFLRGLKATAVSLIQLDAQMDHGPILGQEMVKIELNDNYLSLSKRLADLGAVMLNKLISSYLEGKIEPQPQADSQASFCQMLKKEDGQIDWSKPAQEINNQIRAFIDWPTSFTTFKKIEVKIIKARVVNESGRRGEVIFRDNKMLVGAGQGCLEILELQPAGKKPMNAQDFMRGYKQKIEAK
jgi:methionyl-tRNA formyltransferase